MCSRQPAIPWSTEGAENTARCVSRRLKHGLPLQGHAVAVQQVMGTWQPRPQNRNALKDGGGALWRRPGNALGGTLGGALGGTTLLFMVFWCVLVFFCHNVYELFMVWQRRRAAACTLMQVL
jgi:hypothetical protein